ncbi:MAG: 50S ribosomal protein L6 [Armatimonadota bacterium]
MSRIGNLPIEIPEKVSVELVGDNRVVVKGPLGELEFNYHPDMSVSVEDDEIIVTRPSDGRDHRALHGTTRSLIANMVEGVVNGYEKRLLISGVGYRAEERAGGLTLRLGFSYPYEFDAPDGIEFEVPDQTTIIVRGADKQLVGETAAEIRSLRPVEPYKGHGIRYSDERVRRKAGKARIGEM